MPNDYYNHSQFIFNGDQSDADLVANEFEQVEAGFAAAQTDIDAAVLAQPNLVAATIMPSNLFVNGRLGFWQDDTVYASMATGQYFADHWLLNKDTNDTIDINRTLHTPGSTWVPGGPNYMAKIIITAGGTGAVNRMDNRVENVRRLAGRDWRLVVFGWPVGNDFPITVVAAQIFGAGGSPFVSLTAGVFNFLADTPQAISVDFTMPSITGKTPGTNHHTQFQFRMPVNVTREFNFGGAILVPQGLPLTTLFEDPALELQRVRRYRRKVTSQIGVGHHTLEDMYGTPVESAAAGGGYLYTAEI